MELQKKMKFAWLTDIHLEFLYDQEVILFLENISEQNFSGIFLTGDISTAPGIVSQLKLIEEILHIPIYFVLGNHDYYNGDISTTREKIKEVTDTSENLFWLPRAGIVELAENTCIIGHGCWADGRLGNYWGSTVLLNDYVKIQDFWGLGVEKRLALLNQLGDEAASYLKMILLEALNNYGNIFLLTHVPPFQEACWINGAISDDNFLPHFACKAAGDALKTVMITRPEKQLTVFCGHTHSKGHARILPNLQVKTGGAEYGCPEIQEVIQVEP
jgi:Icc-related predicted phosphoesterase